MSQKKHYYGMIVTLFCLFSAFLLLNPNRSLNKEISSSISENESNYILDNDNIADFGNPNPATSYPWNLIPLDDTFSSDPFSGNPVPWSKSSNQISWSSGTGAVTITSTSTATNYYFTCNTNCISGHDFTNIKITVNWAGDFSAQSGQYIQWEYWNGTIWQAFGDSDARKTADFTSPINSIITLDTNPLLGIAVEFQIRLNCYIDSWFATNSIITVHSVQMQLFSATITDEGVRNNLDISTSVKLDFTRSVSISTYNHTWSNYRLYYNFDNSDVQNSPFYVTNSSGIYYNADHYSLNFTIPESAYNINGTLYYAFRIRDPTAGTGEYIWSSTYNFQVYDGIAPNFTSALSFSHTNATLEYDNDFQISGNLNDNGGMGLYRAYVFWRNTYPVFRNQYSGFQYTSIIGSSFSVSVPASAFVYGQVRYLMVYIYDGSWNFVNSSTIEVTPTDLTAPFITITGNSEDDINYNEDKNITFDVSEPSDAVGIDGNSIACYFKVNENNLQHAVAISYSSHIGNSWTYTLLQGNYSYGDVVYLWMIANDTLDNQRIEWFSFSVKDEIFPTISDVLVSFEKGLVFEITCNDGIGGSGIANVQVAIGLDMNPDWSNEKLVFTAVLGSDGKYNLIIPAALLKAGPVMYIVRVTDEAGNTIDSSDSFLVTQDMINSANDDQNNDSDDDDAVLDSNMIIFIGAAVATISTIGIGIVVIRKKKASKAEAELVAWEDKTTRKESNEVYSTIKDHQNTKPQSASTQSGIPDQGWETAEESAEAMKARLEEKFKTRREQIKANGDIESSPLIIDSDPNNLLKTPVIASNILPSSNPSIEGEALLDTEMRTLLQNAREFADLGDESMTLKTFEMLFRLGEKKGTALGLQFLEEEKKHLLKKLEE